MFGTTLYSLLGSPNVNIEDKARAYKCFKRMQSTGITSNMCLRTGDRVTITGLKINKSLNGESGVLGSFENGRWQVPALAVKVRPENLIKQEWKLDSQFNTSVSYGGLTYIVRIEPDKTVRCITHLHNVTMVQAKFPWDDVWMQGFNRKLPEESDI